MCVRKKATPEEVSPPPSNRPTLLSNENPPLPKPAPPPAAAVAPVQSQPQEQLQLQTPNAPSNHTLGARSKPSSVAPGDSSWPKILVKKKSSVVKRAQSCKDSDVLRPPSNAGTPAEMKEKKELLVIVPVAVDPPKKMYVRRQINEVREPKAPEYKTLADLEASDWETAGIIPKADMKKDSRESSVRKNSKRSESKKSRKSHSQKSKKEKKEAEAE